MIVKGRPNQPRTAHKVKKGAREKRLRQFTKTN